MILSNSQLHIKDHKKTPPRVRFAPSPTGLLHIGGARTALFNWLFAKREGGTFVLRIEDTDLARSKKEFEEDIIISLKWLGISWDEGPDIGGPYGPYRQSERLNRYETYLRSLLSTGKAYYCFCHKEDLEKEKESLLAQGLPPKYTGRCRNIPHDDALRRVKYGDSSVIRIVAPQSVITFHDIIRGNITFNPDILEDFIIAKGLSYPLYNFAATIDDAEMNITHVIRGEEHISNTPRQIMIQRALGLPTPTYAHLPLILNADRAKLSKRFADTSVRDYKTKGYLPHALINFIALLGWHPTDDRELLTKEELIALFDITRVQKAGAVFSQEKLDWTNAHYIKSLSPAKLLALLANFSPELVSSADHHMLLRIVTLEKERMKTLADFKELSRLFFKLPQYDSSLLIWKTTPKETIKTNLQLIREALQKIAQEEFSREYIDSIITTIANERGRGEVFWPLRVAISGNKQSPPPLDIIEILGKIETIKRIDQAISLL